MQRLHVDDLSGHLLDSDQPWVHLNIPAVATTDETWPLSDGRSLNRSTGEAIAPQIESKSELYTRMHNIGAYNFGAQYQQAPFKNMNDEEDRCGVIGCEDEWGHPGFFLGCVPEVNIMAYEVFGIGDRHPAPPVRQPTMQECARHSRWVADYQRRLLLDPNAKYGPPEGEDEREEEDELIIEEIEEDGC